MDVSRFDALARSLVASRTRRGVLGLLTVVVPPAFFSASTLGGKKKKKKKCKRGCKPCTRCVRGTCKPDRTRNGAACGPDRTCAAGACLHAIVTCSMRNDPVCQSKSGCACAVTGFLPETGSTRHCGTFGGSADPCATARPCGLTEPCPRGYVCDQGAYSFLNCPDGRGRCAENCGG